MLSWLLLLVEHAAADLWGKPMRFLASPTDQGVTMALGIRSGTHPRIRMKHSRCWLFGREWVLACGEKLACRAYIRHSAGRRFSMLAVPLQS
jgi:hypothetical protein